MIHPVTPLYRTYLYNKQMGEHTQSDIFFVRFIFHNES